MRHSRAGQSVPKPAKAARQSLPSARGSTASLGLRKARGANEQKVVQATDAKNRFGAILKSIRNAEPVYIEKHGKAEAVVLDIASYRALVHKARSPHEVQLDTLRDEFDALYASMQSTKSRKAADKLFAASAAELNRIAAQRAKLRNQNYVAKSRN